MKRGRGVWAPRGVTTNDKNSLEKRRLIKLFKWTVYTVYLIFAYIIMVSPNLFAIAGIKPLLIIPLVVCISVFEDELSGGIFAIFAGLVWGANDMVLFTGYYSFILYLCCVVCGLLIKYFLKAKLINVIFLCLISTAVYMSTSFFFKYGIWGYDGLSELFIKRYIPSFFYTLAATPIYFILIRCTHERIRPGGKNGGDDEL